MSVVGTCLVFLALCTHRVFGLAISSPSSSDDYRQMSFLLASTFDAPTSMKPNKEVQVRPRIQTKVEEVRWNLVEKALTEAAIYKRYTATARRMQGKKYCVLLAKAFINGDEESEERVVGMAEMGMSICPSWQQEEVEGDHNTDSTGAKPQPTLGVICVSPSKQNEGVGKALLAKCEEIASNVWNESFIFADVEPRNDKARDFFSGCGYCYSRDERGNIRVRNTKVSNRSVVESKPHYLLWKRLESDALGLTLK